jgi:hypothetical protein
MHLFIIDLFISLDTLAPVINKLNNHKKSTSIYFINPFQNFSKHKLIEFLNKNEQNKTNNFLCLGFKNRSFYFFLKIIMTLPKFILLRLFKFWNYIYHNKDFFSEKQLVEFFKKNNFKTVTIENSLNKKRKVKIINVCNRLNIPIINIASGLFTVKKKEKIDLDNFDKIDFFLTPNLFAPYQEYILNSKKFKLVGSPRYDEEWIDTLSKIYMNKYINKNLEDKINVVFFQRTTAYNFNEQLILFNKIKNLDIVNLRIGNKPREIVPLKVSLFGQDIFNTTELINWADIVVSSATSILVESVQKNKLTICLEYLQPEKDNYASFFSDYPNITKIANSDNDVIKSIEEFKQNNKIEKINQDDLNDFYKSFIYKKDNQSNILDNIINIYLNINYN